MSAQEKKSNNFPISIFFFLFTARDSIDIYITDGGEKIHARKNMKINKTKREKPQESDVGELRGRVSADAKLLSINLGVIWIIIRLFSLLGNLGKRSTYVPIMELRHKKL